MTRARRAGGWLVGLVIALGVVGLSEIPTRGEEGSGGLLRLSWRVAGVRIEECRTLTDQEREALAPHMRVEERCEGQVASYELSVTMDERTIVRDTVAPSGARGDRPVYVFVDVPLVPGTHEASVAFSALLPEGYDSGDQIDELRWSGSLVARPREISLLTLDASGGSLELRTP